MASRSEILAAVKGQQVRVPDLQALLQEWPQYTNPYLERLRVDVDAKLEELIPAGKRLQQMKRANIAHFAATWWPYAEYEALKYVAYLSIWLFNWDDEVDSTEFSNMADHIDAEQRFRQDTLAFIRQCLSPVPVDDGEIEVSIPPSASDNLIQTPESGDSRSSSSGSTSAEASSASSSPSTGLSTANTSPRNSTTTPQGSPPYKRHHKRGSSLTKITAAFMQHVRRPSTSPQANATIPTHVQKTDGRGETSSPARDGKPTAINPKCPSRDGKSTLISFKNFASTIASYFRPRKDSGIGLNSPEPIAEGSGKTVATNVPSRSPLILSFKDITEGVCPHLSPYEHRNFLLEGEKFVNATEREQELRVRGVLPSLEEYMAMRLDTGAVAMCLALHEYALAIQLPNAVRSDPDMAEIWLQSNTIIWIVNDMLSIKKEIAVGETDSLIPILIGQGRGLQAAMDHGYDMTHAAVRALDAAALRLKDKVEASYDARVCNDVEKFVESCRMACTGSTNWSVESGRYKIGVSSLKGGVVICLE